MTDWNAKPSFPCPCCDFISLRSKGSNEICPVCDWEDEGYYPENAKDLDAITGPNNGTLRECRLKFSQTIAKSGFPKIASKYERFTRRLIN